jgi:type IV secretion system protein VirD4
VCPPPCRSSASTAIRGGARHGALRLAHCRSVGSRQPVTLYLVVPPSDINRTKPLIRLILNQIGRRLTEELTTSGKRHRLLLMLDEFPALGRLDFFESARLHGGLRPQSFLIAQSLNQIEKAYGPNNAILDNCHVRVSLRHERRADGEA